MKIFYFMDDMEKSDFSYFLSKLELLKQGVSPRELIDLFMYKLGEDNRGRTNTGYFFDAMMFLDTFSKKFYLKPKDILEFVIWVHNDHNFYIHNHSLYSAKKGMDSYEKLDFKEAVYFVTSRDTWLNPFFSILYKISSLYKNLKVIRPNKRGGRVHQDDKVYNISKLYSKSDLLSGALVVPYMTNRSGESIRQLLLDIKKRLGDRVVLKLSSSTYGEGIKMFKISQYLTDDRIDYLKMKYFTNSYISVYGLYFVPYHEIETEYRLYFFNDKKEKRTHIASIKTRNNQVDGDVFQKTNFEIGLNVVVTWDCHDVDSFLGKKENFEFVDAIVQRLDYDRGVIEVFRTRKGKLVFSEFNSLGGLILFSKDQKNMMTHRNQVWGTLLELGENG